ncbi:MAG: hypothetical protein K6T30_08560, partial [Alicyclobacillus sp.]|nr:hypothetical protein [Alicyclobacillus sp.]
VARRHGIAVLPPSVSESGAEYSVAGDRAVRTGLLAIRHVGRAAVQAILDARAAGPFRSLVDFLERVDTRACNRKAVESLLEAGALNPFLPDGATPSVAREILDEAYRVAESGGGLSAGLGLDGPDERQSDAWNAGDRSAPDAGHSDAWNAGHPEALFIRVGAGRDRIGTEELKPILAAHAGDVRVALYDGVRRSVRLLEPDWSVSVTPELVARLEELVGLGNVRLGRLPARAGQARRRSTRT